MRLAPRGVEVAHRWLGLTRRPWSGRPAAGRRGRPGRRTSSSPASRQLRDRLAVAADHLDDDLQRREAEVVGQVGADAEREPRAVAEAPVELDRERHVQAVGEDQRLGAGIDAVLLVVADQPLAPVERIAGVVACAVEELAEIQVEVAQERVDAVDVGQRDAEVAAVLARPHLEAEGLRIAQPGPSAWQACRYSCAIVPSGSTPCFIAYQTLLVPAKFSPSASRSPTITSSCQVREKRRRVP